MTIYIIFEDPMGHTPSHSPLVLFSVFNLDNLDYESFDRGAYSRCVGEIDGDNTSYGQPVAVYNPQSLNRTQNGNFLYLKFIVFTLAGELTVGGVFLYI